MVLSQLQQRFLVLAVVSMIGGAQAFSALPSTVPRVVGAPVLAAPSTRLYQHTPGASTTVDDSSLDENKAEHQSYSLDLSKTIYTSSIKSPKDSYIAFAEKGAANAKMAKRKIFHQSVMGGCYVGFGGLLSLSVAGNIPGIGAANPGLVKMAFAALFPVNLLLILTTGGQLFTGNSATVAAARYENLVDNRELLKSWAVSLAGNVVGCSIMAFAAWYAGCLVGGTANLCTKTAVGKLGTTALQNFAKAIMCNWMVSLAVFLAGATNDLVGKLVAVWFPISLFVAIGLEHSVANLFLMPAAMLLNAPLSWADIIFKNVMPVLAGNAVAGALLVAGSYSYQFGALGGKRRIIFAEKLAQYERKSRSRKVMVQVHKMEEYDDEEEVVMKEEGVTNNSY
uniref:Formate/nitrite transporter n=1 Tax=Entomoneis paludosa TaxID=265537 RepID=A0A7S2VBD0_9STRA|mmetsp:Transcript_12938/g.26846  ORF Transcript_12938/g.26846 Transcript_12938/m.26846 type:complete len:395 (+) Transcript_12938:170-1354(+)